MATVQAPTTTVHVAVGNIKSLPVMPPQHVGSDVSHLFGLVNLSKHAAVFGAEIITEHGYMATWLREAFRAGMHTAGTGVEVPVSATDAGRAQVIRLTRGVPRISPDRFATILRCHVDGFKVAYIATHNVNGTDNPRKFGATMVVRKVLFARWRKRLRRHIDQLHRDGWTVIVGGDLNRHAPVHLHPGQVEVINDGLMQLAVIAAAGVRARRRGGVYGIRGYTDHPLCAAAISLTERA